MPKENLPKILVIEDEKMLLTSIEKMLQSEGFDVVSTDSAKGALENLKEEPLPDVIWLDYYLPDMNGLELMHELKKNNKWEDIPVIVVSNSASPDKLSSMLSLGAEKYILKAEHRLDDIVKQIKNVIKSEDESTDSRG